jgi:hypothetical protein
MSTVSSVQSHSHGRVRWRRLAVILVPATAISAVLVG